ncbi:mitotic checkpoint protein BUB3.3-like [Hibiscus syriacus]|uniref:mitotic checkpoint protein BUB3.3-like n=1 Tax=Hibiscus syriacus TaxID=106335 RepID=UPI001924BCCA|nr:mitotic checkpoint protein BUB3.3-like [Hibiscus syriacus]
MNGSCLEFENPIRDAISRIRFAPQSNNLLISSWDSSLRLFEVDCSKLRLETSSEAALLDCCFQEESVSFSAGSDGSITRYDLQSGISNKIGNHDDMVNCAEYSTETRQVITAGFDKKIIVWDMFGAKPLVFQKNLDAEVESMSLSGFELIVAVGSSVDIYDLRNLDQCVQSNESCMDVPIRCVSSIPYSKHGILSEFIIFNITALREMRYAVGSVDGRVKLEIPYPSGSNNMGYMFRCHPKSRDRRNHVVPVNDIALNPFISGVFVTGDNAGYVTAWDAKSRRRLFDLPSYSNSIASLTYNHEGQILAVASSHTFQEATEIEKPPQISVHKLDESHLRSVSDGSSSRE